MKNRTSFVVCISVTGCNPNGDPNNGNAPRQYPDGRGFMTDVCIKHKIRMALHDMGENILILPEEDSNDELSSIQARVEKFAAEQKLTVGSDDFLKAAKKYWFDVRTFGQLFALEGKKKKDSDSEEKGVSAHVTGCISMGDAKSVDPVTVIYNGITKCVNGTDKSDGNSRDRMGSKSNVLYGMYVERGSIDIKNAEKNGFTADDAVKFRQAMANMLDHDLSAARQPENMYISHMYWLTQPIDDRYPVCNPHTMQQIVNVKRVNQDNVPACDDDYSVIIDDALCQKYGVIVETVI